MIKRNKIILFVLLLSIIFSNFSAKKINKKKEENKNFNKGVYYFEKYNFPEAIIQFKQFLKKSEDDNVKNARALFYLGNIYRYRFEYDKARYYFQKIIGEYPDSSLNMQAQFYIARIYDEENNLIKATDYYNNILMSDIANNNYKKIAKDELKTIINEELNYKDYEYIVDNLPKSKYLTDVYIKLAKYYLSRNKYDESEDILEKIKEYDSNGTIKSLINISHMEGKFPGAKIGVMLPFTGKYSKIGNQLYHSISLMKTYKNEILEKEKEVKLIKADTQSETSNIPQLYKKMVENGAKVVLGPINTKHADKLLPYVKKYKVPVIFLLTKDNQVVNKSKYFFRNAIRKKDEFIALANYGVKRLKLTHLAALVPKNGKNIELCNMIQNRINNYNASLSVIETYNKGDTTYTKQLKKINETFVDGLILKGTDYEDLHQLIPTIPYVGLKINVLADSKLLNKKVLRVLKKQVNGFIVASYFNKNNFGIMEKDLYNKFKDMYNYNLDQYTVLSLDAFNLSYEALKRSGGLIGKELLHAFDSLNDEEGFCGKIKVLNNGDIKKQIYLYEIKDGVPKRIDFSVEEKNIVEIQ